ncbi:MAG: glycoside hydrolase family 5 protein, partial [Candidatus Marinimicrobia bacterium]|nr:glycoside hydrolase family 5 protein [Candidatus Neomarinimicrobiota bacterium]
MKIFKSLIFLLLTLIITSCVQDNVLEDPPIVPEDTTLVQKHGLLQVNGNRIVDKDNEPVCFAGNSFFWSNDNWGGERYYTPEVVSWLKLDWKTTIVRAAMGVEDPGGYLDNNVSNKNRVVTIVDAAIDEGLYVIIDWHSHHAEDNTNEAVTFFEEMADLYGEYDNVIYEIYNEPLDVSWSATIKPYADSVISAIRAIDPDNLIVVGTPEWSQRVDLAAADPITNYSNIAYTLHF